MFNLIQFKTRLDLSDQLLTKLTQLLAILSLILWRAQVMTGKSRTPPLRSRTLVHGCMKKAFISLNILMYYLHRMPQK